MTIKERINAIINTEHDWNPDGEVQATAEKMIAMAYYIGRNHMAESLCEYYNALIDAQRERANACRYSKMANSIIGEHNHLNASDFSGSAREMVSKFGNDVSDTPYIRLGGFSELPARMNINDKVEWVVTTQPDWPDDGNIPASMHKMIDTAYNLGRCSVDKKLVAICNQLVEEQRERARACRYGQMANAIIGDDLEHIYYRQSRIVDSMFNGQELIIDKIISNRRHAVIERLEDAADI